MRNLVFWTAVLGALLFAATSVMGGYLISGYDPISQFISESVAKETIHGYTLRYMGFLPSGMLLASFGFLAPGLLPRSRIIKLSFWGLAIFYGLGTMITAIFPCEAGCVQQLRNPSFSQFIHDISGGLTYLLVPVCIVAIGIRSRSRALGKRFAFVSLLCGLVAALFVMLMFLNLEGPNKGLYQRIIEGGILFWILYTAYQIKKEKL